MRETVLFVALAVTQPVSAYVIRATCVDGTPDSVSERGAHTELAVPHCDTDAQKNGRCTFRLYFGCEPPLLCVGTDEEVVVPRHTRRRFGSPPSQTYKLRCISGR